MKKMLKYFSITKVRNITKIKIKINSKLIEDTKEIDLMIYKFKLIPMRASREHYPVLQIYREIMIIMRKKKILWT